MDKVELLTVEHAWLAVPEVLLISPSFPVPWDDNGHGWQDRTETVAVVTPDGGQLEATAQINMTHLSIRDPEVPWQARWRVRLWLTDRTEEEVPVGSRILVSPDVREALLHRGRRWSFEGEV